MSAHVAEFLPTLSSLPAAAVDPAPANTGNGTVGSIVGKAGAPTETITLTATSSSNFTVTGSVSGALAAATVGSPYTSAIINFTITAGGTPFVAGDNFTISVTAGGRFEAEWKGNPNKVGFDHAKELTFETQAGVTGVVQAAYTDDPAPADYKPLDPSISLTAGSFLTMAAPPGVKAMRVTTVVAATPAPVRLTGRLDL